MQVLLKTFYVISTQQLKKTSTFKHSRNECDYWTSQISNYCQINQKDFSMYDYFIQDETSFNQEHFVHKFRLRSLSKNVQLYMLLASAGKTDK